MDIIQIIMNGVAIAAFFTLADFWTSKAGRRRGLSPRKSMSVWGTGHLLVGVGSWVVFDAVSLMAGIVIALFVDLVLFLALRIRAGRRGIAP